MSSSIDLHLDHQLQLQLMRYPDLHKTEYICNQSPSNANILQPKAPNRPALPIGDDLHLLRHMKLPLKLPLRRKFITLGEANSSSYGLSCKSAAANSTSLFNKRSSSLLDLAVAEGKEVASAQEELPSMEESNEEEVQDSGVEMVTKTKQKFLVQLAEHPHEATVESQYKSQQKIESSFGESSNSARTCRICGREFPSGRALGGHMRVHGALLFAGSIRAVEQERNSPSELQETIGSASHAYSGGVEVENIKALTTNFLNSQMDPQEVPNRRGRHHQEAEEEEEEERVCRTVHLSSFDYSRSFVSKADNELLGYGDANSHELLGKRTSTPALYELRQNPKPNQRFFRDQLEAVGADWQPANACIASSNIAIRRSRSPSPESATARSCSECGKVFLSWKALFGHMRCHPERDWRGIQPPERNLELDLATHPSTPKASYAENISDCQQVAVSTVTHLAFTKDQEPFMKAHMQEYGALNSKLLIKSETASHASAKDCSLYPASPREFKPQQKRKNVEEAADATEHAAKKSHCKKRSMKRVADYCKAPTIDRFPSWLTRNKRSKRTQELHLLSENKSFTSETIYSELTPNQQYASQLESCDDFIVANSLMMLSNAGELMQQSEGSRGRDADHVKIKQAGHAKKAFKACSSPTIQSHVQTYRSWDGDDEGDSVDEAERKAADYNGKVEISPGVKYQCSTCKKCFNSHQALGGHRASHKKMKGCFAQTKTAAKEMQESNEEYIAEEDDDDDDDDVGAEQKSISQEEAHEAGRRRPLWQLLPKEGRSDGNTCHIDAARNIPSSKKKGKGHECSICHRVFASGQALGGHKRCHWNGDRFLADTTSVASSSNRQSSFDGTTCKGNPIRLAKQDAIDLNLPAPLEYEQDGNATFDMTTAEGTFVREEMLLTAMAKSADTTPLGSSCVAPTSRWSNVSKSWKYEHLMSNEKKEILPSSQTDIDASGCRFHDERFSAMWSRRSVGSNLPQVCMTLQPLR